MSREQLDLFGSAPKPPAVVRNEETKPVVSTTVAKKPPIEPTAAHIEQMQLNTEAAEPNTSNRSISPSIIMPEEHKPAEVLPIDVATNESVELEQPDVADTILAVEEVIELDAVESQEVETLTASEPKQEPDPELKLEPDADDDLVNHIESSTTVEAVMGNVEPDTEPKTPSAQQNNDAVISQDVLEVEQNNAELNIEPIEATATLEVENVTETQNIPVLETISSGFITEEPASTANIEAVFETEFDIEEEIVGDEEAAEYGISSGANKIAATEPIIQTPEWIGAELNIPEDKDLFKRQYYSMRETTTMFNISHAQLRFWENEFSILQPRKNRKGDRYFRPVDIKNLEMIYHLLRVRKFTLDGAKEYVKSNKKALDNFTLIQKLDNLKVFLHELKANL